MSSYFEPLYASALKYLWAKPSLCYHNNVLHGLILWVESRQESLIISGKFEYPQEWNSLIWQRPLWFDAISSIDILWGSCLADTQMLPREIHYPAANGHGR